MPTRDAQKSEVHDTTADASGSPTAAGDADATRPTGHGPAPAGPAALDPPAIDVHVVSDDTDAGGPLVIESSDPDLTPPKVPSDPFPTDRTPEVDPPVEE